MIAERIAEYFVPLKFDRPRIAEVCWLGRQDSNLRMPVPKTGALPLGDAPAGSARLAAKAGAEKPLSKSFPEPASICALRP